MWADIESAPTKGIYQYQAAQGKTGIDQLGANWLSALADKKKEEGRSLPLNFWLSELLNRIDSNVSSALGELNQVSGDSHVAGNDLCVQSLVLLNGPTGQRPGSGGQANCIVSCAQGGANTTDVSPLASVVLVDCPNSSVSQALHSGGDNSGGVAGLVNVNAY